jgi:hypothetical protein
MRQFEMHPMGQLEKTSFSQDGKKLISICKGGFFDIDKNRETSEIPNFAIIWFTPEGVIDWLRTADVAPLSDEMRQKYNLIPSTPWYKNLSAFFTKW